MTNKFFKTGAILFLLVALLGSGCTSIRMRYDADVAVGGKTAKFSHEQSYSIGSGLPVLCVLTGIFFGGACWFYTVMPTTDQRRQSEADAKAALEKALGGKSYEISACTNDRVGWTNDPESVNLNY
jgi:hypothetical protein